MKNENVDRGMEVGAKKSDFMMDIKSPTNYFFSFSSINAKSHKSNFVALSIMVILRYKLLRSKYYGIHNNI